MSESRDYLEMSFRSIECFMDDGKIDAVELGKILEIAEQDGNIDSNEVRVLQGIISRVKSEEVDSSMKNKLQEIAKKITALAV